jgi:hypothetical protein
MSDIIFFCFKQKGGECAIADFYVPSFKASGQRFCKFFSFRIPKGTHEKYSCFRCHISCEKILPSARNVTIRRMLYVVWEFRIKKSARREFEFHYSSNGTWTKLFRRSPDYIETILVKDRIEKERYLLIDVWKDWNSFRRFKSKHKEDYDSLDQSCERLTTVEKLIGHFQTL